MLFFYQTFVLLGMFQNDNEQRADVLELCTPTVMLDKCTGQYRATSTWTPELLFTMRSLNKTFYQCGTEYPEAIDATYAGFLSPSNNVMFIVLGRVLDTLGGAVNMEGGVAGVGAAKILPKLLKPPATALEDRSVIEAMGNHFEDGHEWPDERNAYVSKITALAKIHSFRRLHSLAVTVQRVLRFFVVNWIVHAPIRSFRKKALLSCLSGGMVAQMFALLICGLKAFAHAPARIDYDVFTVSATYGRELLRMAHELFNRRDLSLEYTSKNGGYGPGGGSKPCGVPVASDKVRCSLRRPVAHASLPPRRTRVHAPRRWTRPSRPSRSRTTRTPRSTS